MKPRVAENLAAVHFRAKIQGFFERERIEAGSLLVAVSGGPDSMALLHGLQSLTESKLVLIAAHLNHMLRGDESNADQAFVEQYCRRQGIECRTTRLDVRKQSIGENLESAARRVRYEWLTQVAREHNAAWIATGHTADDQAETVLHHFLRGTGLRGLRGIAPRRPLTEGIEVIRPLLQVDRAGILAFLDSEAIEARQDSSNSDLHLTRNRIRHELLPYLKEHFNPEIVTTLCRMADQASDLYGIEETKARAVLAEAERRRAGRIIVLDAKRLAREEPRIVREIFHLIWEREEWPRGEMNAGHWNRLVALVQQDSGSHDLPGVRARRKGNVIQLHELAGLEDSAHST